MQFITLPVANRMPSVLPLLGVSLLPSLLVLAMVQRLIEQANEAGFSQCVFRGIEP